MNNLFKEFITPEEAKQQDAIIETITSDAYNSLSSDEKTELQISLINISQNIYKRYLNNLNNNLDAVLQDMHNTIDGVTKKEFKKHLKEEQEHFERLFKIKDQKDIPQDVLEGLRIISQESLKSFIYYIDNIVLYDHYRILRLLIEEQPKQNEAEKRKEIDDNIGAWIYEKYLKLYPNAKDKLKSSPPKDLQVRALDIKEEEFLKTYHGKPTDTFALMIRSDIKEKPDGKGTGIIKENGVSLEIVDYEKLRVVLGASAYKLLLTAITDFTKNNNETSVQKKEIVIPLKEYAIDRGIEVEAKQMKSLEEQQKENKRAEVALKRFRIKTKEDLKLIYNISMSWKEKMKGEKEETDFMEVRLLGSQGIQNGCIKMTFTQPFSDYLAKCLITQYPKSLLKIDDRNPNALNFAVKMSMHYHMDNNQMHNTADHLQVKTLLQVSSLPTIEKVREQRASWEKRIKEPFEKSLKELKKKEFLEKWYYGKSKGKKIPDEEADFDTFEEWAGVYVYFTLKNAPDQTKRIDKKQEELKNKEAEKGGNTETQKKTTTAQKG